MLRLVALSISPSMLITATSRWPLRPSLILHTWSLAVSGILYLDASSRGRWYGGASCLKITTRRNDVCIFGRWVRFLAWCLWQSHSDVMGSAFFSLRARAWEPLAGGV